MEKIERTLIILLLIHTLGIGFIVLVLTAIAAYLKDIKQVLQKKE